jgi:hypothetical protein
VQRRTRARQHQQRQRDKSSGDAKSMLNAHLKKSPALVSHLNGDAKARRWQL